MKKQILEAMSAAAIPEGSSGLWHVKKIRLFKTIEATDAKGRRHPLPPGTWTSLFCYTEGTLHQLGALVMHDYPYELAKHLIFALRARGRVLITGLGLGCIARGCLANPAVESVTVIENSKDVLKLVGPFMPKERLEIIEADALEWTAKNGHGFDYAWHDLWIDDDKAEPGKDLQVLHSQMICALADKIEMQGAWEFPRWARRLMREQGIL